MMSKKFDWRNLKKTDWLVLVLLGIFLLVLAIPSESKNSDAGLGEIGEQKMQTEKENVTTKKEANQAETYAGYLEEKLERVLREMEGVGRVKVMITLADCGERIVEKDSIEKSNSSVEKDDKGGSRDVYEKEVQTETVYVEDAEGNYPYIEKELLPTVEGVLVVAEGGGNSFVVSEISKATMALFPVEAHKIIVVKMSQGG